jgi:hypothetical protein
MKNLTIPRQAIGGLITASLLTTLAGCNSSSSNNSNPPPPAGSNDPAEPAFSATLFDAGSTNVNHAYFPLQPGVTQIYQGTNSEGESEHIEVTVSHKTRVVDGIQSAAVITRGFTDDELAEETVAWFAQDTQGNVWQLGETSVEIDEDKRIPSEDSWQSGLDIAGSGSNAIAGIFMKKNLQVGDRYAQQSYKGVVEDQAEILALDMPITLLNGSSYNALKIRNFTPLEPNALDEFSYFAANIGLVVDENADGSDRLELVETVDQKNRMSTRRISPIPP